MTVKNHFLKPLGSEDEEVGSLALEVEAVGSEVEALVAGVGTLDVEAGTLVAECGVLCVELVSSESMNLLIDLSKVYFSSCFTLFKRLMKSLKESKSQLVLISN